LNNKAFENSFVSRVVNKSKSGQILAFLPAQSILFWHFTKVNITVICHEGKTSDFDHYRILRRSHTIHQKVEIIISILICRKAILSDR
jgi:hypothetical protein